MFDVAAEGRIWDLIPALKKRRLLAAMTDIDRGCGNRTSATASRGVSRTVSLFGSQRISAVTTDVAFRPQPFAFFPAHGCTSPCKRLPEVIAHQHYFPYGFSPTWSL